MTTPKVPTATDTGPTYIDEVGADGCGCPVTAGFTANGSEVEGTQRTVHRAKCWAAELTGYAATAAELRRIADALDTLPGALPYVQLSILPNQKTVEAVDAMAVLGKAGRTERNGTDWHHVARSGTYSKTNVYVTVQSNVPAPPDERDVELERLRAELAALKPAEYGRAVDNGDASAEVPNGVEGGPVTGRATGGK